MMSSKYLYRIMPMCYNEFFRYYWVGRRRVWRVFCSRHSICFCSCHQKWLTRALRLFTQSSTLYEFKLATWWLYIFLSLQTDIRMIPRALYTFFTSRNCSQTFQRRQIVHTKEIDFSWLYQFLTKLAFL